MLVSLEDARAHLRIDSFSGESPDDAWLEIMIPAISEAVLLWLKDEERAYEVDSEGERGDVRPVVRAAVLVELASQYRFRESEGAAHVPAHWGHGYNLGIGATALLTPLRRSTVA